MNDGYQRLWAWFGSSRASWLTMPRVLMHEMPDDWQERMAKLCDEWDEKWDSSDMPNPIVNAQSDGKFTKWPQWLLNYRHPDKGQVSKLRKEKPQCK